MYYSSMMKVPYWDLQEIVIHQSEQLLGHGYYHLPLRSAELSPLIQSAFAQIKDENIHTIAL